MIVTESNFKQFIKLLKSETEVVIDTETTGLKIWDNDRLCGIGFYLPMADQSFYLPYRHRLFSEDMSLFAECLESINHEFNLPMETMQEVFLALRCSSKLIGHNIKFDLAALHQDGYEVSEHQELEDTLCGARLYFKDKHPDMSLENLSDILLNDGKGDWKRKFKEYIKFNKIKNYALADITLIAEYCEYDCRATYGIRNVLWGYALATNQDGIYEREKLILKIVWGLERLGLNLDLNYISDTVPYLESVKSFLQEKLNSHAGKPFDPWSNKQLTEVFNEIGQRPISKTELGNAQWTDQNLQKIGTDFAKLILNYREIDKLLNTFFIPYQELGSQAVHTTLSPWGAVTGRFTCSNPNLQQVQRVAEWDIFGFPDFDIQVRKMFIPPPDHYLYCMDYAQMEMLVFSDYLGDQELRDRLNAGGIDFHSLVAKMVWKVDETHPRWKQYRIAAKSISLGLIYGMGIDKLAAKIGVTKEEAQSYKNEYFKAFPTAASFMERVKSTVETRGFVYNRFGRRYYLPADKSYAAVNYLVQGTSADLIKEAMIRCTGILIGHKSRLSMQMHDEFDFYIHKDELDLVPILHEEMENNMLATNLPVDISRGNPNWGNKVNICKQCYKIKDKEHICE